MILAFILAVAQVPEIVEPGAHCAGVYARHIAEGHRPLRNDPYVAYYRSRGEGLREAREHRVTVVLEICETSTVRSRALAELTRVDQAYDRIRHPTDAQTAAYLRRVDQLSRLVCPNGMNDDDGYGDVGCD